MAIEDQRAAVGFSVTLSGQLIAAAMATLAVEGAYVWYALGARATLPGFEAFATMAAVAIAVSIFTAGKGITRARNAGFDGAWSLAAGKRQFNIQAVALLIALTLLAATFAQSGPSKQSLLEKKVDGLRAEIAILRGELQKQPAIHDASKRDFMNQVQQLSAQIRDLRAQLPKAQASKP